MRLTRTIGLAGIIIIAVSGCVDPVPYPKRIRDFGPDEEAASRRLDQKYAELEGIIRQEYQEEQRRHQEVMEQLNSPSYISRHEPPLSQSHFSPAPIQSQFYLTGQGHWIDEVMADGEVIKLEDGSLWKVSPIDTVDSQVWLPVTSITVIEGDDPEFTYKLVNTDDNEIINARLISQ